MLGVARPSLWRHGDFRKLWTAATVSVLGSQVTLIALPYIALKMLSATVFQVSLLAAIEMLPFLLFTLPAGAWLDRVRRRPILVAADIGRGVALMSIPVAYVAGALTLTQLFVVAFITGTFTALFDIADQSFLPDLLERADLVEGNARLQISYSAAQIGGPTLAGNMIAVVAAPIAIVVDALSFFISGGLISAIKKREPKPERALDENGRPTSLRSEIAIGLRYVVGDRYLRPIAGCTGTSNLFGAALFGIFPVLIWRELDLPTAFYGTVMGLASFGFLAGAAMSSRLPRSIGIGPTIVVSAALSSPAFLLMTLTPASLGWAAITLFGGWFVVGFTQVIYNVAQISLRQSITPLAMQSRMNATMRFIVWGTIPIGSLMGGVMATLLPVRVALVIAALGSFASSLWVLFSPVRSLREMPAEPEAENPGLVKAA
ncbi:MAG: MFS transporter [Candidatus Limnocylindrales bacterium]|jgi:MFS family permease